MKVWMVFFSVCIPFTLSAQWVSINANFDGSVFEMVAVSASEVYFGGNFQTSGGVSTPNIALWNGVSYQSLDGGTAGTVYEIAAHPAGGVVVIGGFDYAGGIEVQNVAHWDGNAWHPLGAGAYGTPDELAVAPDGSVYIIDTDPNCYCPVLRKWNGIIWTDVYLFTDWSSVTDLTCDQLGNLILAGTFTQIDGIPAQSIAGYDGSTFYSLGSISSTPLAVYTDYANNVYARLFSGIRRFDGAAWVNFITASAIFDLAFDYLNRPIVCGGFTSISGVPLNRIARWNGTSYEQLGDGFNNSCSLIAVAPTGEILAKGAFTASGGTTGLNGAAIYFEPFLLPVIWGDFSAKRTLNGVDIAWETLSEVSSDYFTVERSNDLERWTSVTFLAATGTTQNTSSYQVTDNNAPNEKTYYRVVETDVNGNKQWSSVISIEPLIEHYSIAVQGSSVVLNGSILDQAQLVVCSSDGRLVHQTVFNANSEAFLPLLPSGVYVFTVVSDATVLCTLKFFLP
ncbi:MAG: hypothetical protein RL226_1909 [Bacteroidota bacterium]